MIDSGVDRSICDARHEHTTNCEECGKPICHCFALCYLCWSKADMRQQADEEVIDACQS